MPAATNDSAIAGPASVPAATPVSTKMPVPMMTPTPKTTRSSGPSVRRRPLCSSFVSSIDWSMDFVRSSDPPGMARRIPRRRPDERIRRRALGGSVVRMRLGGAWRWAASALALAGLVVLVLALRSEPSDEPPEAAVKVKKASFDSEAPGHRARALAAARGLGLQPLAALRRGPPVRAARRDARRDLAPAARRPPQPRPARRPPRLAAIRRSSPTRSSRRARARCRAATYATLRSRAQRTITQGHLSQHLLFHSLHQFSIPSEAPAIFGVTDAEFRALRRGEQSPLEIGRLHGRSPSRIQELAAAVLRERVDFGVRTGVDERAPGPAAAAPPGLAAPALARAGALQRPAADAPRQAHAQAAQLRGEPGAVARRRADRLRGLRAEAAAWRSSAGRSACSRARPARASCATSRRERIAARRARRTTRRSPRTGAASRSSPPRATSTSPSATARSACSSAT